MSGPKQKKMNIKIKLCIFELVKIPPKLIILKTEKVNTTIEFCMFELVEVPNFSSN